MNTETTLIRQYLFDNPQVLLKMNIFWSTMTLVGPFVINYCSHSTSAYSLAVMLNGWIFFAYQFVFYQVCCVCKIQEDYETKDAAIKVAYFFTAFRLLLIFVSFFTVAWMTSMSLVCSLMCEALRFVQVLIVVAAPFDHYRDIHFASFFMMLSVLLVEIVLDCITKPDPDYSMAYNYFTVKTGVLLFETAIDRHWQDLSVNS